MKITKNNVIDFATKNQCFNFFEISKHFNCDLIFQKKERYNLQKILFNLCDNNLLKYSNISHRYYTIKYYNKIKGIK